MSKHDWREPQPKRAPIAPMHDESALVRFGRRLAASALLWRLAGGLALCFVGLLLARCISAA